MVRCPLLHLHDHKGGQLSLCIVHLEMGFFMLMMSMEASISLVNIVGFGPAPVKKNSLSIIFHFAIPCIISSQFSVQGK